MKTVYQEMRGCYRVKDSSKVKWQIKDTTTNGNGRIRNISTSGMLLETDSNFSPSEKCFFAFEALNNPKMSYIPSEGRLVWSKKSLFSNKFMCGIEFIGPAAITVAQIKKKIKDAIEKVSAYSKVKTYIGGTLMLAMALMSAYIVTEFTQSYKNIRTSHQTLETAYEEQASLSKVYSDQLVSTKALLVETESILSEVEAKNKTLNELIKEKDTKIALLSNDNGKFNGLVAQLNEKNIKLNTELIVLQESLRVLEGNVNTFDEGKAMITVYKDKLRKIKFRMKDLRKDAVAAKIAAQKENDRLESLLGNNGYFVREGKVQSSTSKEKATSNNNIQVDVQFYK